MPHLHWPCALQEGLWLFLWNAPFGTELPSYPPEQGLCDLIGLHPKKEKNKTAEQSPSGYFEHWPCCSIVWPASAVDEIKDLSPIGSVFVLYGYVCSKAVQLQTGLVQISSVLISSLWPLMRTRCGTQEHSQCLWCVGGGGGEHIQAEGKVTFQSV